MIDIKQFISAIKQIAEEKGIPQESVLETVEAALGACYKREYGKKGQIIKVKLDSDSGSMDITQTHYVIEGVDEDGYITGPLPEKVALDRGDVIDQEGRRRASADSEAPVTIEAGGVKVNFNPEKHILLTDMKAQ